MPDAVMQTLAHSEAKTAPTVLVVEDEELVRALISEYLQDCGYKVLEAGDAREAISLLLAHHIDIVFSDVRMPGEIDGFGLARWLRLHHPTIPVLLTSGYHRSSTSDSNSAGLIDKPYSLPQVSERIGAALRR